MASDDTSGARPSPVVLRIKLRYDDVETMVQRFAPNVGKSGLFLPTRAIQPIGTEVKFELRIADDTPVLVGLGRVKAVREPDPANPKAAFGMAIELMRVSRDGGEMIKRMIAHRRALGLPSVPIPMPEDLDAARRSEAETSPRAETSGIVREMLPTMASAPVAEQLLTSPRAFDTGPVAYARVAESGPVIAPLAPEPSKPRRVRVAELIAQARSGPVAAVIVPGLDQDVDVGRALARARALASGDLDAELDALRDEAAAPIEISVEAASAELARQLGGAAIVRKERSGVARWAPPPAVETPAPVEARSALEPTPDDRVPDSREPDRREPDGRDTDSRGSDVQATDAGFEIIAPDAAITAVTGEPESPDPIAEERDAPIPYAAAEVELTTDPSVDLVTPPVPQAALLVDDDADRLARAVEEQSPDQPEPVGDPDEEEDLDSLDMEPLDEDEHTQIGEFVPIDPDGFQNHSYSTVPPASADLAQRLEAQLADAEAEADAEFASMQRTTFGEDSPLRDAGFDELAEGGQTAYGADAYAAEPSDGMPAEAAEIGEAQAGEPPVEELGIEEIDDLDVIAVADADDADLLSADGEADASDSREAAPAPEAGSEGSFDFASRLDLGDDSGGVDPADFEQARPIRRAGFAASFVDYDRDIDAPGARPGIVNDLGPYDPPSGGYTVAEDYRAELEIAPAYYRQRPERDSREPQLLGTPPEDDLEHALGQLDVDLDDLSIRQEGQRPVRPGRAARTPTPARPARAPTDDGIVIDFEDDEEP